jgi:hypothetical protein
MLVFDYDAIILKISIPQLKSQISTTPAEKPITPDEENQ